MPQTPKKAANAAMLPAQALLQTTKERKTELETALLPYDSNMEAKQDSEDRLDVKAPLMEAVYLSGGNKGLLTMTNFVTDKIEELWGGLKVFVAANWNIGQGQK